jgi:hypothetical protein
MTKNRFWKTILLAVMLVVTTGASYGQLFVPAVSEIGDNHEFVIVIKGNSSINAKVLMQDGRASTFDFDPNNLNQYPTWKIRRINVSRGPNVKPLSYTTFMCTSSFEYFAFGKSGDNKMMTSKEYDKFWEKDETGKSKYDISDMYHFAYREYVEDDGQHIRLTYHSDKKSSSTTQVWLPTWPSDKLKLVLVKL